MNEMLDLRVHIRHMEFTRFQTQEKILDIYIYSRKLNM